MMKKVEGGEKMELLFFGGRHRYPGETVSWGDYFAEWMEHPVLAVLALFCMIWMFVRIYGVWKSRREEERAAEWYPDHMEEAEREEWEVGREWKKRLKKLAPHLWKYLLFAGYIAFDFREYPGAVPYVIGLILVMLILGDLVNLFLSRYHGDKSQK